MKKPLLLFSVISAIILAITLGFTKGDVFAQVKKKAKAPSKNVSCLSCHEQISNVLPKNHKPVTGDTIASCNICHRPDMSTNAEPKPYASIIHRAHIKEGKTADCMICHTHANNRFSVYKSGVSFGRLKKEDFENIKNIFMSWAHSKNIDATHGKVDILCSACHDKKLPVTGDTVENDRCLTCHGPLEALQKRSEPKDFPDRNPHKSHLGDIACTVCHHSHKASTVYCLGCHGNFKMKIPGG